MFHAPVCLISLRPSLRTLHLSLPSSTSSSWSFTSSSMWMLTEQDPLCTLPNEESDPWANNAPLTGYEPNFFDNYHFSETTKIFIQESSSDTRPSYLHDTEISDETIGRALSSPLFTQEREEPAGRRQVYQSPEESLLPSQSLSVGYVRTGRPVNELSSLSSSVRENPSQKMSKSGFSWNDKKSKFSLIVEQRFRNTSSKPIMTEEVSKNWMELSSLNEVRLIVLWQETNNFDEINNFFMNNYWSKIENFLKLMWSLNEMEELKWFQGSTFDEFSRRRLIENQDTILALTARIQELQNEVTCDDSRDFKDAESVRSGQSHVTSQPAFFPPFRDPYGMLSRSLGMPSRNEGQPSIWDTQGISGNVFANPTASSSAPYPARVQSLGL